MTRAAPTVTVLLVEDDEDDAVLTRSLLRSVTGTRYVVDWARTMADVDRLLAQQTHDVHLVDYRLGEHNGLDVARRVLEVERHAPVIMLTGHEDRAIDVRAAEAGVADYLVKGSIDAASIERSIRYAVTHQRALRDLSESEERYALALAGANDGLWDWDLRTGTLHLSARWASMLGYRPAEMDTTPDAWLGRVHPADREHLQAAIDAHLAGHTQHFESEHRLIAQDGSHRWLLARGMAVRGADGRPSRFAGSQTDITARKSAESRLEHGALHDALTGLPNRVLFLERLDHALRRGRRPGRDGRLAVLFLDLDRFKLVNDSLGHQAGDRLLIAVAHRLQTALRPGDTVARLGGDEFTLLLEEVADEDEARMVAGRLLEHLAEPFLVDGREHFLSASIGITLPGEDDEPGHVVRDADAAMYRAKGEGRGRHAMFDARLHDQAVARLDLETRLRRGLSDHAASEEGLAVVYQAIVDARTERITGFEALARWVDADGTSITGPADFVPVAEDTGLIHILGRRVLDAAIAQAAQWQRPGHPPVTVSVNISRSQLLEPRFASDLERALAAYALPPPCLRLEVTETLVSADPLVVRDALEHINARLSVPAWLDDFGTGASSLRFLHRFPGDAMKIDRSFVQAMDRDAGALRIVKAIIGLAHDLGLKVVAEGVETPAQMKALRRLGCDLLQGFLLARPLPSEAAGRLLTHGAGGRCGCT